ncbi:MAG: hydrolase, TatD family [Firmicutes bacterium]|nr:hydrolase, TatD family [Bacillota bacterium]
MIELFDTHAHIDDEQFDADREDVIIRAAEKGVKYILCAGASMESSARAVALAESHPDVYAAVGVHPHDAGTVNEEDYLQLAQWATLPKVAAIGEIGLDYYYDLSPRDVQKTVFGRQLDLARQVGKPFIIHDRDAHGDILDIVRKQAQGLSGVFHCFSGSWEMAKELLKLGYYLAIGGPVTFKNAAKVQRVAAQIPLDRLLIETDCPYLTPHPHRGHRNEPAYVRLVAEEIARIRNISLEELAAATTFNAKQLFKIE